MNEDEPMSQDRRANHERSPQGTISSGERFGLLIPQFPGIFKEVQSARLYVNDVFSTKMTTSIQILTE